MDLNQQIDAIKLSYTNGMVELFQKHLQKTNRADIQIAPWDGFKEGEEFDPEKTISADQAELLLRKEMGEVCRHYLSYQVHDIITARIQLKDPTLQTKSHCRKCYGRGYRGINVEYFRDSKGRIELNEKGERKIKKAEYSICDCLLNQNKIEPKDETHFRTGVINHLLKLQKANRELAKRKEQEVPVAKPKAGRKPSKPRDTEPKAPKPKRSTPAKGTK